MSASNPLQHTALVNRPMQDDWFPESGTVWPSNVVPAKIVRRPTHCSSKGLWWRSIRTISAGTTLLGHTVSLISNRKLLNSNLKVWVFVWYKLDISLPYVFTTIIGIFSSHSKFDKVIRVFSPISVAITRSKFVRKSGRLLSTCSTDSSTQSPLTSGFNSDNNLKGKRKNCHYFSIEIFYRLPSSKSRQITEWSA